GDQARGQLERLYELPVPRSLIVISKPIAIMSNPVNALWKGDPFHWWDAHSTHSFPCFVDRVERIAGKHMLDVSNHQFLVLLFMMQAKSKDRREFFQPSLIDLPHQVEDMLIDIPAVLVRFLHGRPGDQTTLAPAMPFPQRVVV